jgi:hypothetical protein
MFDRITSALVALSLASLVWLYVRSRDQETLDNVPVPVHISLAPGQKDYYELEITGPSQVSVSFTGPPSRIREVRGLLQRGELQVGTIFAVPNERQEESQFLDTVRIDAADIHAPPGVSAIVVEGRNRIPLTVRRMIEKRLPVRFETSGEIRVAGVVVEPASVLVRGPKEVLDRVRDLPTQLYSLPQRLEPILRPEEITSASIPLVQELGGRPVVVTPTAVVARMTLQPQQKVYELAEVPIRFLCPPNFLLRPAFRDERAGKIMLRVQGPAGEEPPAVVAYVDLGGRKWDAGLYEEPLQVHLPKDYQLVQNPPRLVAFQLAPGDGAVKPTVGTLGSSN